MPASVSPIECEQEVLLLLWRSLTLNRPFVDRLLTSSPLPELLCALCSLLLSWADDRCDLPPSPAFSFLL